ncbi:MAG: hypothetical protein ACRCTZ_21130 [Sarcina sp.]
MQENNKHLDSLQGKLNGLKSSWSEFSNMLVSSGIVGFFIDLGKVILGVGESVAWFIGTVVDGFGKIVSDVGGLLGFKKQADDTEESVEILAGGVEGLRDRTSDATMETDLYSESMGELNNEMSKLIETNDSLESAIVKLGSGMELSGSEIANLLDKYPELQNQLDITAENYGINIEVLEKLREANIQQMRDAINAEISKTQQVLTSTIERISAHNSEITSITNLAEAYAVLAGAQQQAMQEYIGEHKGYVPGGAHKTAFETASADTQKYMRDAQTAVDAHKKLQALEKKKVAVDVVATSSARDMNREIGENLDKAAKKGASATNKAAKEAEKLAKELEKAIERFEKFKESVLDANKSLNALNRESVEMVKNLEQLEKGDFSVFDMDEDKTLEELRPLIETHRKEMAKLYGDLEKLKKVNTGKLTEEEKKMYDKQIEMLKENIKEQESIQKDYAKNLENIRKDMEKQYQADRDAYIKAEKEKFERANAEAKKFQESEKDRINDQKDALKDLQEFTMDMIKQEKDVEVDALNDRINAIDELVDVKKKALKQEQESRDYQKGLKKKEKDVADIEKRIAELQFDTSAKGIKERLELEAQLAEKKEELEDYQYDESIKKQENALDEQADREKKALEEQLKKIKDYLSKEGQIRDDANKLIQNNSEELYDKLSQYNKDYVGMTETELKKLYDTAISGLEEWGGAQQDVNSAFDSMADAIDKVIDRLEELSNMKWTDEMGQNASDQYDKDQGYYEDDKGNIKPSEDKESDRDKQRRIIKQMQDNSAAWSSASSDERDRLAKENERLAKQIGAWKSQNDGAWYVNIDGRPYQINNGDAYKVRHNGLESGFVGERPLLKSNEEFNKLLKGELVINSSQMDNFMKDILPKMMSSSAEYISNSSSPSLVLNINGNVDQSIVPQIKQTMENGIQKLTQHMKNNGYRVNAKSYGI